MMLFFKNWLLEIADNYGMSPPQQLGTTAQLAQVCTACPRYSEKRKGEENLPSAMKKKMKKIS